MNSNEPVDPTPDEIDHQGERVEEYGKKSHLPRQLDPIHPMDLLAQPGNDNDVHLFSSWIAQHFVLVDESTTQTFTADAVLDEYLQCLISHPDFDLESPLPSVAAPSPWHGGRRAWKNLPPCLWARHIPAPAPITSWGKGDSQIRNTRLRQRNLLPLPKEPSIERK